MVRKANILLRTRTMALALPAPRPSCPVCATLWRIQNPWRDPDERMKAPPMIRRGGLSGSCGYCSTVYKTVSNRTQFYYVAKALEHIVKEKLANYWLATHKGPLPSILHLEEQEGWDTQPAYKEGPSED